MWQVHPHHQHGPTLADETSGGHVLAVQDEAQPAQVRPGLEQEAEGGLHPETQVRRRRVGPGGGQRQL